ncbi:alpha/beta fold hydrolase [Streptomyces diastaticus]|uniref:alpha/beta fold hydrolase n=1 Tax=Streptomyces diastaticus TaxID=1956 RepID=UPI00364DB600
MSTAGGVVGGGRSRAVRGLAAVLLGGVLAGGCAGGGGQPVAVGTGAGERAGALVWGTCPEPSEAEAQVWGAAEHRPAYARHAGRLRCGTLTVPVDWSAPEGRRFGLAVAVLPSTGGGRAEPLALNPGGPGVSGRLMPVGVAGGGARGLLDRYDLVGLDVRGTGRSRPAVCPAAESLDAGPPSAAPSRRSARAHWDRLARAHAACAEADPAWVASLTTADAARDLEALRAALGAPRLHYYGVSWGTSLGVTYRTLFPGRSGRMLLESVVAPDPDLRGLLDGVTRAREQRFERFAAWLADRSARYRLGTDAEAVRTRLLALRDRLTERPLRTPSGTYGSAETEQYLDAEPADRAGAAAALAALARGRAPDGGGDGKARVAAPPLVAPFAGTALLCSQVTHAGSFAEQWAAYGERRTTYPVMGGSRPMFPGSGQVPGTSTCAGLPAPDRPPVEPGRAGGPLLLVAHRDEVVTPLPWARAMRARTGGSLLVVADGEHATVTGGACAGRVTAFFTRPEETPAREAVCEP